MKEAVIVFMVLIQFAGGSSFAQPNAPEYELTIAGRTYDIALDTPNRLTLPGGAQVEVLLHRKELRSYTGAGISFQYHHEMKFEEESANGYTTLTMDSPESPLAIVQVYSVQTTPEEVRDALFNSLLEQFQKKEAEFNPDNGQELSQRFSGKEATGKLVDFQLNGIPMQAEVYAFRKDNLVVATVFQFAVEQGELAAKYFSPITRSLK